MKARPPVARVSGRATRTGAARRGLALCWPRAGKTMARGVSCVAHAHRHVHAWQVNVRVAAGDDVQAAASARASGVAPVAKTVREVNTHHATLRELRTMRITASTQATRVVQRVVDQHSTRVERTSTMASRTLAATLRAPKLAAVRRVRDPSRTATLAASTSARATLPSQDMTPAPRKPSLATPGTHTTARELVWRSPDPARKFDHHVAASVHPIAQPAAQHASTPQPAPAEIATAVAAQVRKATAAFATPEGPALDRLADEVMRRVEKSLRVERERRGR